MSLIRSDIHLCGCVGGFEDASSRRARRGLSPTNSAPLTVALTVPNASAPLGAPTSPGTVRSERVLPSVRNRFNTRSSWSACADASGTRGGFAVATGAAGVAASSSCVLSSSHRSL